MKLSTENLAPPSTTDSEWQLSEVECSRRQAEIARCLGEFRAKWDSFPAKEPVPLAEVIPIDSVSPPDNGEDGHAEYLSSTA